MINKYNPLFILMILILGSSGCADDIKDNSKIINIPSSNDTITMGIYTENDLRKVFNEVRSASFTDSFDTTQLIFKNLITAFGMSAPFKKIYININEINKYNWPEDAVRGLFAHELSHQVQYKRRSFMGRYLWLWNYAFSGSKRRKVEKEADEIALERGYEKEIVRVRTFYLYHSDKKHADTGKKYYLSVEDLEKIIAEKK